MLAIKVIGERKYVYKSVSPFTACCPQGMCSVPGFIKSTLASVWSWTLPNRSFCKPLKINFHLLKCFLLNFFFFKQNGRICYTPAFFPRFKRPRAPPSHWRALQFLHWLLGPSCLSRSSICIRCLVLASERPPPKIPAPHYLSPPLPASSCLCPSTLSTWSPSSNPYTHGPWDFLPSLVLKETNLLSSRGLSAAGQREAEEAEGGSRSARMTHRASAVRTLSLGGSVHTRLCASGTWSPTGHAPHRSQFGTLRRLPIIN